MSINTIYSFCDVTRGKDTFPTFQKLLWYGVWLALYDPLVATVFLSPSKSMTLISMYFQGEAVNRGLKTSSPGDQQNSSLSFVSFGMKSSHLEIRFDQFDQQTRSPLCVEFLCNFHRLFGGYSKFPRCQFLKFLQTRKNMRDCFIIRRAGRV